MWTAFVRTISHRFALQLLGLPLRIDVPVGLVTAQLVEQMRAHRAELIELLCASPCAGVWIQDLSPDRHVEWERIANPGTPTRQDAEIAVAVNPTPTRMETMSRIAMMTARKTKIRLDKGVLGTRCYAWTGLATKYFRCRPVFRPHRAVFAVWAASPLQCRRHEYAGGIE